MSKESRTVIDGTTTLFAALDTASGKVLTKCRARHRHQEYLSFLREIEKNVPKNLEVHIIVDNYATHKHLRVRRWFATRPRFHVHFIQPTPPGSIRSRSGSIASRNKPFAGERSAA
jgi:hypothetical protein